MKFNMEVCYKAFRRDAEKDPRDAGAPHKTIVASKP
jgi:hypothetical protein